MAVYSASCSGNHPDGYGTMTLAVSYNTNSPNTVNYTLSYSTGNWTTWYSATTTYTIQIHTASWNGSVTTTNMTQAPWSGVLAQGSVNVNLSNVEVFSFSFAAGVDNSWGPMVSGAPSGTLQIPSTKWTISYHQNGLVVGDPWPENQSVKKGESITLSSVRPNTTEISTSEDKKTVTFNGNNGSTDASSITFPASVDRYTFNGWATSSTATSATYQPGATITPSENINLYPAWTKTAITSFNIVLPYASRYGYKFKGWGTSSNATSVVGTGGQNYLVSANVTLYAIWEQNAFGGAGEKANNIYIKNSDSWKRVQKVYIKNNNSWKEGSCFFKSSNVWNLPK